MFSLKLIWKIENNWQNVVSFQCVFKTYKNRCVLVYSQFIANVSLFRIQSTCTKTTTKTWRALQLIRKNYKICSVWKWEVKYSHYLNLEVKIWNFLICAIVHSFQCFSSGPHLWWMSRQTYCHEEIQFYSTLQAIGTVYIGTTYGWACSVDKIPSRTKHWKKNVSLNVQTTNWNVLTVTYNWNVEETASECFRHFTSK